LDHLGRIHARRIQSEPREAILRNVLYGSMVLAIRSLRRDEYRIVGRTCESTQVANIVRKYVGLCLIAGELRPAQLAIKGRDRNSAMVSRFAIIAGDYDYENSSRASIRFSLSVPNRDDFDKMAPSRARRRTPIRVYSGNKATIKCDRHESANGKHLPSKWTSFEIARRKSRSQLATIARRDVT